MGRRAVRPADRLRERRQPRAGAIARAAEGARHAARPRRAARPDCAPVDHRKPDARACVVSRRPRSRLGGASLVGRPEHSGAAARERDSPRLGDNGRHVRGGRADRAGARADPGVGGRAVHRDDHAAGRGPIRDERPRHAAPPARPRRCAGRVCVRAAGWRGPAVLELPESPRRRSRLQARSRAHRIHRVTAGALPREFRDEQFPDRVAAADPRAARGRGGRDDRDAAAQRQRQQQHHLRRGLPDEARRSGDRADQFERLARLFRSDGRSAGVGTLLRRA